MIRRIEIKEDTTLILHRTRELPQVIREKAIFVSGMNIHRSQLKKIASEDCVVVSMNSHPSVRYIASRYVSLYNHAKIIITPSYLYVSSSNLSRTFFIESTLEIRIKDGFKLREEILQEISAVAQSKK